MQIKTNLFPMNELTCRACGCRIVPEHGYYNTLDGACCITCRERRPLHRLKLQVCDCAIRCFTTSRQIPNCSVSGRSYKKNCIVI